MLASGFKEVSSVIIITTTNTTGEIDELSAYRANQLVSSAGQLPVYQEQPGELVLEKLQAYNYDVLIIDRCSRLVYHLIPPWSALNYPYVKAAILSTYIDDPCGPCQADRSRNVEDGATGNVEDEVSGERNGAQAATLAPFVKTKDGTLPVRVVMRHPHTHRGRAETMHYRYIELQTGNPGYHGHLEGDGSSHMDDPTSQTEARPHSERTSQSETRPHSERTSQSETTPHSVTNPGFNTPPNSEMNTSSETVRQSDTTPHSKKILTADIMPYSESMPRSEAMPCSDATCRSKAEPGSETKSNCQGTGNTRQDSTGTLQKMAVTNKQTKTIASHEIIAQQAHAKEQNSIKDHVVESGHEFAKKGNFAEHYGNTSTKNTSVSKPDLIQETIFPIQKQKVKTLRKKKIKGRKNRKKFYSRIEDGGAKLHVNKKVDETGLNQTCNNNSLNATVQLMNKSTENTNLSETHELQINVKELNVNMSEELQTNCNERNDSTKLFKDSIADESHIVEHDLKEDYKIKNTSIGAEIEITNVKEGEENVNGNALKQGILDEPEEPPKQNYLNVTYELNASQNQTAVQCNTSTCIQEAQQGLHMRNKNDEIDPIENGIETKVEKSKIKKVLIEKEEQVEYTGKTDQEKQNVHSKFLGTEEEDLSALMNMIKGTDEDKGTKRKPLLTEHFGGSEDDPDWYSNTQQKLIIMHYAKLYPWLDFD